MIFGFLVGVPCALFVSFANTLAGTIATLVNLPYPWDIGEYVLSAIIILSFVQIRLQLTVPIHTNEGTKAFRSLVFQRHAFLPYLPTVFILTLWISFASLNPSITVYYRDLFELATIQSFFTFAVAYPFMVGTLLVLTSPGQYVELLRMEFDYFFYFDRLEKLMARLVSFLRFAPAGQRGKLSRRGKAMILISLVLIGAYLPIANGSLVLFTPRLDSETFTSYPSSTIITVSSSAQNLSKLYVAIPVTAIYNFSIPLVPIFGVFVGNPSNLTGFPFAPFVGSYPVGIEHSKTGPISVVQVNGTNRVQGFEIQPLARGGANGASLVLRYNNNLTTRSISLSQPQLISNMTLVNGTRILTYAIQVENGEPFNVNFFQVFLMRLPSNQANYTGFLCATCASPDLWTVAGTPNLFGEFNVGARESRTLMLKVWFRP